MPIRSDSQRRVMLQVGGGVIADDVDHAGARAPRVVDVGHAVREARAQMQQGRRRPSAMR